MVSNDSGNEEKEIIKAKVIKKAYMIPAGFRVLRVLAWGIIILSIMGAIAIGAKYMDAGRDSSRGVDLMGIAIAIVIFMFGIFGGVFMLVIASISENLILLRHRLDQILDTGTSILETISKGFEFAPEGKEKEDP